MKVHPPKTKVSVLEEEEEEEEGLFVFIGYCRGTGAPAVKLTARHSSQLGLCNLIAGIAPTGGEAQTQRAQCIYRSEVKVHVLHTASHHHDVSLLLLCTK